jgi:hypothetical protein
MAAQAIGMSADELAEARDKLAAYLSGASEDLDFWPGLAVLAPARGERSAPPAAGDSTAAVASAGSAPAAMVPAVSTPPASADDLARALRAEGLLRGVDLP